LHCTASKSFGAPQEPGAQRRKRKLHVAAGVVTRIALQRK
jgi:hypothetical protein